MQLDFLVVGFSKCGTTSLCSSLADHPDIFMPAGKDYRFFDIPDQEARAADFESRFEEAGDAAVVGDGSVWYTDSSHETLARQRIVELDPHLMDSGISLPPEVPWDGVETCPGITIAPPED